MKDERCVACGCGGNGTTAETGCTCGTCHAQPGQQLGWLGRDFPAALNDARRIGAEWNCRISLRRDGAAWTAVVAD